MQNNPSQYFDYIIIGAGASGCVLANRLSQHPQTTVCLIEAGGSDSSSRVQIPAGTITLYKSKKFSWNYYSVPQKQMNNRRLHCPRGKVLGGSSSMNSMIYIRGNTQDYNQWAESGCPGWGWDDVLPYFKRSECNRLNQNPDYHGQDGELQVCSPADPNPFSSRFVNAACNALGLPVNKDFNGASQLGCGIYNVTQNSGQRLSSYRAFVAPILSQRPNLTVMTGIAVEHLHLQGKQVIGIVISTDKGQLTLKSHREIILSAGSLGSPHILMKSGIGPREVLEHANIDIRHELPGVGKNLQDHLDGLVTVRSKHSATLGFSLASLPKILISPYKYWRQRKGWLTTNYVEAGGFATTECGSTRPDIQFHFVPGYRSHRGRLFEWGHGYAIHTCVLRPLSIGRLTLNKRHELEIDYNFLADKKDAEILIKGIRLARKILASEEFDEARGKEMLPGEECQTDAQLLTYIREHGATVFHPAGTCKMGTDPMAVVDPELKVYGLTGLRIADASIMPTLISGNTNAPCMMIGEKLADMIVKSGEKDQ
jgi:choline dehydrogenase-like flavoprotein